ncbi:hypothetical protein Glove_21g16 [Diversispora epigaea]|uniref:Uncharacterized protein n=1 Tax=Diversispora epigaea TaxID=1348612 RepID=A0A397JLY7_9GLOM|nr:hypothetical protein Glove_21g16 [Diversispora epigaea]
MWNSGKYKKRSTLTVFCHNNHAWTEGIPEMPKIFSICEALISFVTKELSKATRAWIIGKEILTHEGILYRSSHEWEKLIKTFKYEKLQFIPEELLKWGPVDIHEWIEEEYYHSSAPIPSQELKAEYNELEKFLGGAQSYRFRCWREREDPTPKHIHIDLRGAYFGSELIGQYLTEKEGWILTPLIDYLLSAGWLISVTPREIIYTVRFVGSCARNVQVISVLIRDKNEADMIHQWLARKKCRPNRISNEYGTLIKYEGDKKCVQWLHICSFIFVYTHIAVLKQLKRFLIENVLRVCTDAIYTTAIPETVLDENKLRIDFDESIYTNAKNNIELEEVHKKYNAEINKIKKQYESVIVLDTPEIKYGQWRKKKPGYIYCKEASSWTINHKGSLEFPSSEAPPLSTDSKLITLRKPYLVGQGGSGKTTRAIRAFPNRKIVVLTPTNLLAEYYRKQNPGLTAMTYHKYFHLEAIAIDEWDLAYLKKKTLAEIPIFDEACIIPRKVLQRLLSYVKS